MMYRKDRGNGGAYVCGMYVKNGKRYCTSHLVVAPILLETVKAELSALITDHTRPESLYKAVCAELDRSSTPSYTKERQKVTKRLTQLSSEFDSLFQLYSRQAITINQFQEKNERLIGEQQSLQIRQAELDSEIEIEKDTEQLLHDFHQQIKSIANLDINDERVLKTVIQSLIHKIEIGFDGSIKQIRYNFADPSLKDA